MVRLADYSSRAVLAAGFEARARYARSERLEGEFIENNDHLSKTPVARS